jgi:hypothetical protein
MQLRMLYITQVWRLVCGKLHKIHALATQCKEGRYKESTTMQVLLLVIITRVLSGSECYHCAILLLLITTSNY